MLPCFLFFFSLSLLSITDAKNYAKRHYIIPVAAIHSLSIGGSYPHPQFKLFLTFFFLVFGPQFLKMTLSWVYVAKTDFLLKMKGIKIFLKITNKSQSVSYNDS